MTARTAFLLVDAQVNMFDPANPVHDAGPLLARLVRLLADARAAGHAVVFVRNNGGAGDPDVPGTPGWELHPALQPAPGDVVLDKTTCDTFASTPLDEHLKALGAGRVIVAGLQSEFCIRETTLGALAHGYDVVLVSDGHGTYDGKNATAPQTSAAVNAELRDRVVLLAARDVFAHPAA